MNYDQVEALSNLLGGVDRREDDCTQYDSGPATKNNPNAGQNPLFKTVIKAGPSSATAAASSASSSSADNAAAAKKKKADSRSIWSSDEVAAARELVDDDINDGRVKPVYDIIPLQTVTTADVGLGLSGKNPLQSDAIVVKIQLPNTAQGLSEIQLDVTPTRMLVRTTKYKLFLHLPQTVNEQAGKAQWDSSKQVLSVTLPIVYNEDDQFM